MRNIRLATASILVDHDGPRWPSRCIDRCLEAIDQAGRDGADPLVMPEEPDLVGSSRQDVAEPIPGGACFSRFCERASANHMYVVYSQREAEGGVVYNTGVLVGRDGTLVGKYRKTHLAPGEAEGGVTAGDG